MKIKVKRDGGFVPIPLSKEVDSANLSNDLQKIAQNIYENPDSRKFAPNPDLRDGYKYSLEIADNKKKVKLQFDESNLTDDTRSLINNILQ